MSGFECFKSPSPPKHTCTFLKKKRTKLVSQYKKALTHQAEERINYHPSFQIAIKSDRQSLNSPTEWQYCYFGSDTISSGMTYF